MRADGRVGRVWMAGVLVMAAGTVPARAEGLFGSAQVQFQRVEDFTFVQRVDGTFERRPFTREVWLQNYDLNHRAYPRQNVLVQSTLRFSQVDVANSPGLERSPTGSLRVIHPWANFYASAQPTLTRVALVPVGATALDSANAATVSTRRHETQLVGHVAVPKWPQLDLAWLGRRRDAVEGAPGEQSRQRNARAAYERESWTTYASWTDQRFERRVANAVPLDQRVLRGGGSLRLTPRPQAGLQLQYDYTGTRSGFTGQRQTDTRTHSADANGDWRHTPRWVTSLTANVRRTASSQITSGPQSDHEAALLSTWQPSGYTRLTAGTGTRSVRTLEGKRSLWYATTVAGADGRVRPGWRTNALASNTVNWDPERGTFAVQTAGGSSRMEFGQRARIDADLQVTANGDTSSALQRWTSGWGGRVFVQPLRGINLTASLRNYRVGPGLFDSRGISRTRGLDGAWKPLAGVDLTASWTSTGLLPNAAPRLVTRSVSARLSPRAAVQFTGTWSRSSQERTSTLGSGFTGREFASGRLQLALTRRLAAAGGMTLANPGRDREAKEYDAVVTWSFGR